MSFFDTLKEQATSAVKSTSELIEIAKLNREINQTENLIEHKLASIGKIIFLGYENGQDVDIEIAERCIAVKESLIVVEDLKERILSLKDKKACIQCSAELNSVDLFCNKCGSKQPEIEVEQQEEQQPEEQQPEDQDPLTEEQEQDPQTEQQENV